MSIPFRVSMSRVQGAKLRYWGYWTDLQGTTAGERYKKALKILNYRLAIEPDGDWSEPFQDLEYLQMQMRFGAVDMIGATFGIHEASHQVIVSRIQWIGPGEPPEQA